MENLPQNIFAELVLSPEGHVYLDAHSKANEELPTLAFEKINAMFAKGGSLGLLHLGIHDFAIPLPSSFIFWQSFSRRFVTTICKLGSFEGLDVFPDIPVPDKTELQDIIDHAFLMRGNEYLSIEVLTGIWNDLIQSLRSDLQAFSGSIQQYLKNYNSRWNFVGRVCFHLAENKNNEVKPFAFLATYTTQLSQNSSPQHLPLKRALQDYSGEKNHSALLSLLLPIQKAAAQSDFIKTMVDSGTIFQPLTWTAHEAHCFLKEISLMESSGIVVRVPNWWSSQKPPRPKVVVNIGNEKSSVLGLDTLLDFNMHLALCDGVHISRDEWKKLRISNNGLVKIKGQWVEVNREKLDAVLNHWDKLKDAADNGFSMAEGLRLLAGGGAKILVNSDPAEAETVAEWSSVLAGDWLKNILDQLRDPSNSNEKSVHKILKNHLNATLRPYQEKGVQWMWLLYQLKLGGCLADDMGLGKTIQVLSLLMIIKHHPTIKLREKKPHLLIVPASLLGNWQAEITRFTPDLKILIAHSSANGSEKLSEITQDALSSTDLVITTYAFIHRLKWLRDIHWDLLVLDEAQLIKNPSTKQTLAAKSLKSQVRLTLTGTPIENRLGDLWSLFDFTSPGLLGSSKDFSSYAKKVGKESSPAYIHFVSTLRKLTQPYILRRLKNDKKIITDLPDKTEMQTHCSLSKEQVHLYQESVKELSDELQTADGIKRRGIVLSYLMRFKQICNHPSQWLGHGGYTEEESGKFIRLREICEEIAEKQEKVLIFTQFREIIPAIAAFLTNIFGREGLMLHGDIPIKKRMELVEGFQQEQGPPFLVLSLKAGGTGLNLTRASHVIHFDRWWNPAVENQATDRAYRIGQRHPVLVHKFVCRGTIEEKIDMIISSKKNMSQELLEGGNELLMTEMTNEELLNMISLDIQKALG